MLLLRDVERALERRVVQPATVLPVLRVVCECYTAYRWLPSAITQLRDQLRVEIAFEHTHAPVAALVDGSVDIALLTTSRPRAPIRDQPLFSDEIVFVMAADHPLAERAHITAQDLAGVTLISSTNTPKPELKSFVSAVFGAKPPRLQRLLSPLTEAIVHAARAGLGVAALSEWIAAPYLDRSRVARRMKKPLRRGWRIAYRPEAADRARQLAAALAGAVPRLYA